MAIPLINFPSKDVIYRTIWQANVLEERELNNIEKRVYKSIAVAFEKKKFSSKQIKEQLLQVCKTENLDNSLTLEYVKNISYLLTVFKY